MAAVIDEIPEKVPEADPKNDEIKDDVEAKEMNDYIDKLRRMKLLKNLKRGRKVEAREKAKE